MPNNFLGLPAENSDYAQARYAVLPIPYDSTVSFGVGARRGPAAIIAASQQVELFDDELEAEFYRAGVATLDPLEPCMAGPQAMHDVIFKIAKRVVADGKLLIGLGGEHGVTSGLVRAVKTAHRTMSVLQIDAHADLRDEYEGTPHSHACVMRRVWELTGSIVGVGIRNVSLEEHRFIKKNDVTIVPARQVLGTDDWVDRVLDGLRDAVYVTVDIDGFDAAYAPGTGTPEPGGLDWYQVTSLLRLVAAEKTIVGFDVVEVSPAPGQTVTEFLAARLAYKMVCYMEAKRQGRL